MAHPLSYSPILDSPEMFVVRHKVCLTQTVLLLTTALAPHMSFAAMADAIGSVQYTKYLLDARAYMSHCSQTNPVKGFWKSFGKFEGHIIARRTLSDAYMTDCERRMPVQMEYMESLSGEYLMVDHTFWACKHVSVQVKGARPGQTRERRLSMRYGGQAMSMGSCWCIYLRTARRWMNFESRYSSTKQDAKLVGCSSPRCAYKYSVVLQYGAAV